MKETERKTCIEQDIYSYPWHLMTDDEVKSFAMYLIHQRSQVKGAHMRDRVHGQFHKISIGYKQYSDEILKNWEKTFRDVESVMCENRNLKTINRLTKMIVLDMASTLEDKDLREQFLQSINKIEKTFYGNEATNEKVS